MLGYKSTLKLHGQQYVYVKLVACARFCIAVVSDHVMQGIVPWVLPQYVVLHCIPLSMHCGAGWFHKAAGVMKEFTQIDNAVYMH